MVFSSGVFLPITFIVNLFLSAKQFNVWLLIASLLFYAWGRTFLCLSDDSFHYCELACRNGYYQK